LRKRDAANRTEGEVHFDEGVARVLVLVRALLEAAEAVQEEPVQLPGVLGETPARSAISCRGTAAVAFFSVTIM